jgi:ribonuclease HI
MLLFRNAMDTVLLKKNPLVRPVAKVEGGETVPDHFKPHVDLKPPATLTKAQRKKQRAMAAEPPTIPQDGGWVIHCDGATLGNGSENARAGVGIYFGPEDPRNISYRIPPALYRQTNQVSELLSAIMSVESTPRDIPLSVLTDSKYVVDFVNDWRHRPTWRNADGEWIMASVNLDLQKRLSRAVDVRIPTRTTFFHVYGHAKTEGNIAADLLATAATKMEVE